MTSYSRFKEILLASKHPPDYLARATAIGLFVSLSPTTGFQVPLLAALRLGLNRKWPFHLPLAVLWTLLTNPLTIPFIYYLYIVTGRIVLGRVDRLCGYGSFTDRLRSALPQDASWFDIVSVAIVNTVNEFGLPLLIGWIPWAVGAAILGYHLTLRWALRRPVARREHDEGLNKH